MVRLLAVLVFLSLFAGCGNSVNSFVGQIDKLEANGFIISCSDAANKGKKGAIDTIGYGCSVEYTNQTVFLDASGKSLKPNDISPGSIVSVILEKPVNIKRSFEKKKPFVLTANEIVLLTKAENDR